MLKCPEFLFDVVEADWLAELVCVKITKSGNLVCAWVENRPFRFGFVGQVK